jgi:myo-inositol-1(or 4)-monophosphatase
MIRSPIMTIMVEAVLKASRSLKRDFGEIENLQVSRKGPGDFVSLADTRTEKLLIEALLKARSDYSIITEESAAIQGTDKSHCFYIDPLDGTTNFLHGIPHFCVSVGLTRDGVCVAGVIYDPIKDELFIAEKGKGAYVNNKRLRVAARRELPDALVICGLPHMGRVPQPQFLGEMSRVMGRVAGLRRFGSAALDLAYIAAGRADIYWERGLKSWDVAAGIVIVREAGGYVRSIDSDDDPLLTGNIVCGNELLHNDLRQVLLQK